MLKAISIEESDWKLLSRKHDGSKETYVNDRMSLIKKVFRLPAPQGNLNPAHLKELLQLLEMNHPPFYTSNIIEYHATETAIEMIEQKFPVNPIDIKKLSKHAAFIERIAEYPNFPGSIVDGHLYLSKALCRGELFDIIQPEANDRAFNAFLADFQIETHGDYKTVADVMGFLHSLPIRLFNEFTLFRSMAPERICKKFLRFIGGYGNNIVEEFKTIYASELDWIIRKVKASPTVQELSRFSPLVFQYGDFNDMNYFLSGDSEKPRVVLFDWDEAHVDIRAWDFTRFFIYGVPGISISPDNIQLFIKEYNKHVSSKNVVKETEETQLKWFFLLDWIYCLSFRWDQDNFIKTSDQPVRIRKLTDMKTRFNGIKSLF